MNLHKYSSYEGQHAFLGASNYHWINYTPEKLAEVYKNFKAIELGTRVHSFAAECIRLRQRLPRSNKTLNMYVNDAIGYGMEPEVVLFYSPNCFGTADAIWFDDHNLRIHDLKTGSAKAHMEQLYIYAALFFLDYNKNPSDYKIELRIYQNDEVFVNLPSPTDISNGIQKIISFDKIIEDLKKQEA